VSNRAEFLYSLAEKRRRLEQQQQQRNEEENVNGHALSLDNTSSCARVDAKPVDRDVQMKYDIAKNEEGPLRRTVVAAVPETEREGGGEGAVDWKGKGKVREDPVVPRPVTAENHPGLDERLRNIEAHLAVRYGSFHHFRCTESQLIKLVLVSSLFPDAAP